TRRNFLKAMCRENSEQIIEGMISYLRSIFINELELSSMNSLYHFSSAKKQACHQNISTSRIDKSLPENQEFLAQNKSAQNISCIDYNNQIRLFNLITEVIIKYMKLTLTNLKINSAFIECLIAFASIPFGCESVKNANGKLASISLRSINDIISQEAIVANNRKLMVDIYKWSQQFLKSYETIGLEYSEYIQDAIDFFSLFVQIYYKNYLDRSCQGQDELEYIKLFVKFASSQNSISSMSLCSLTISKLQTEMISTTNT
ncbi:hypothetical protein MXB_1858, partial [Myxobolus squamalis]